MITAHSLPASFVTHTLCLFTFNTLPKASIPQSSPRDISGTNTEIKKEITINLDFSLLILLIVIVYTSQNQPLVLQKIQTSAPTLIFRWLIYPPVQLN